MRGRRIALVIAVVVAGVVPLVEAGPAAAGGAHWGTGTFDLQFAVSGTLPGFPCTDCTVGFSGSGAGAGHATSPDGRYNAAFTLPSASVSGEANYTEPGVPFCPTIGSAAGWVSVSGDALGVVHRASTPDVPGTVLSVWLGAQFVYQRTGSSAALVVPYGTAVIMFSFPDTGTGYFISSVLGAGAGAFEANPVTTASGCLTAGPLPFTLAGGAGLTLT